MKVLIIFLITFCSLVQTSFSVGYSDTKQKISKFYGSLYSENEFTHKECGVDKEGNKILGDYQEIGFVVNGIIASKGHFLNICNGYEKSGKDESFIKSHELGHLFWYEVLTEKERKDFEQLHAETDFTKPYISFYASTSKEEDFAETFRALVTNDYSKYTNTKDGEEVFKTETSDNESIIEKLKFVQNLIVEKYNQKFIK